MRKKLREVSMKIISVVGARPNFMKVAPIQKVFLNMRNTLSESEVPSNLICHTGHPVTEYDYYRNFAKLNIMM